jgi:hypothetical protein
MDTVLYLSLARLLMLTPDLPPLSCSAKTLCVFVAKTNTDPQVLISPAHDLYHQISFS